MYQNLQGNREAITCSFYACKIQLINGKQTFSYDMSRLRSKYFSIIDLVKGPPWLRGRVDGS